ncbi:site-specific integrase [Flavobacterium sp. AG291]|uniref:site-specific integrase n=1 Tax=Flavobacterium sp. AG291 TaxID=2184000 RepID=UPI000E0AC3B9|nr:site-specific integrase [Flavobacterium sp. AG291]RDI14417.1 site-specific recombinase XerD [Flavobacterium sp. AG291]
MLKAICYLKTEKTPNGDSPIFIKISHNQKSITISTGKFISRERWLFTNKLRNPLKVEKEKVIKQYLDNLLITIEKKYLELSKLGLDISLNDLRAELKGKRLRPKAKSIGIMEAFEKHNTYFKRKVEAGERTKASMQKYTRSKDLLKSYIKKYYSFDDYPIDEINSSFVYNLESFLKYESVYKGKVGIKNNSVVKYIRNFKTICAYAIKMNLVTKNPFDIYEGKINIKEAQFLTQQELDAIEQKQFSTNRLEKVKDIFLFSCYTGYAPIDALNLTSENLFQDNSGNLWIRTIRAKTAIKANVPVLPPTLRIIDKYREQQQGLLPKISNQKMNAYLKEIADVCNIQKNLTWYVSRHTFATTITLANGIKIENVSAMLGHTNIKQTQHYAKVLDTSVMNDMMKLNSKYQ